MRNYCFATKNSVNGFDIKIASYDLFADLPLTGRPGLLQSYMEAGRPGFSQRGWASHRVLNNLPNILIKIIFSSNNKVSITHDYD